MSAILVLPIVYSVIVMFKLFCASGSLSCKGALAGNAQKAAPTHTHMLQGRHFTVNFFFLLACTQREIFTDSAMPPSLGREANEG